MTVSELIAELQRQPPHQPVKVLLAEIYGGNNDRGEFVDDMVIPLTKDDAIDAHTVRNEGSYVLVIGE